MYDETPLNDADEDRRPDAHPVRRQAGRRTRAGGQGAGPDRRGEGQSRVHARPVLRRPPMLRRRPDVLQERDRRVPQHREGQGRRKRGWRRSATSPTSRPIRSGSLFESKQSDEIARHAERRVGSRPDECSLRTAMRACCKHARRPPIADSLREIACLRGSLVVLLFFCGCAGYQIGNQSLYPPEIHTVYVPMFQSNSFRRNLGERLTEAVVKEIESQDALQGRQRSERRQRPLRPHRRRNARRVLVPEPHRRRPRSPGRHARRRSVGSIARAACSATPRSIPLPAGNRRRDRHGQPRARGRPVGRHRPAAGHLPHGPADRRPDGKAVVE